MAVHSAAVPHDGQMDCESAWWFYPFMVGICVINASWKKTKGARFDGYVVRNWRCGVVDESRWDCMLMFKLAHTRDDEMPSFPLAEREDDLMIP